MDYEARERKQTFVSRVNPRAHAKLKEKARKAVTTVKGRQNGKVAWWR